MEYYNYHAELERVKSRASRLEMDNAALQSQLATTIEHYNSLIDLIPIPLVMFDTNGTIEIHNSQFIELLTFNGREHARDKSNLKGLNISQIVSKELFNYIESFIVKGNTFTDKSIDINGCSYSSSLYAVNKEQYGVAIFRRVATKEECGEEMMLRLNEVIDSNLSMIQKIGSILGEEVSKNTEKLSSIIKLIK